MTLIIMMNIDQYLKNVEIVSDPHTLSFQMKFSSILLNQSDQCHQRYVFYGFTVTTR